MKRREFITLLGGAAAWPLAVRAQQPAKVVGVLNLGPASVWSSRVAALRAGLRDLGWVECKNIVIEFRWADNVDQLPRFAAELVRMNDSTAVLHLRCLGPTQRRDPVSSSIGGQPPSPLARCRAHYGI